MGFRLLSIEDFYTAEERFWERVDPTSVTEDGWRGAVEAARTDLESVLGRGDGRAALDASCGTGTQALALALLGWRVTGADLTAHSVEIARTRAARLGVAADFRVCDMRALDRHFPGAFDCVVTCGALDNVSEAGGVRRALAGMHAALRPGGRWYLWLRDLEWVVAHETRYKYKGTRRVPHGQVITVEDWHVESDAHVVHVYAHLHEDLRRTFPDEPWQTEAFGYRRRILKKAELAASLRDVGFDQTVFLPQAHPWEGYRVTARKPAAEAAASGRGDPPHVRLRPARPPA